MAAWITSSAPQTPTLSGTFNYTHGMTIPKWYLKHPAYQGPGQIEQRWGKTLVLVLGTERPGKPGEKLKKLVVQKKYLQNTTNLVSMTEFWLPVLIEGDPIQWEAGLGVRINSPGKGTNFAGVLQFVYHLPLIGGLSFVSDVVRLGTTSSSTNVSLFSPLLNVGETNLNPGRHVSNFGGHDYYWEDSATSPHFETGTVSSKGSTVTSGQSLANPFQTTIFVANPATYTSLLKKSQLYEYTKLNVGGKEISAGTPLILPGVSGHVYSNFAINPGPYGLSKDGKSYVSRFPIAITNSDYSKIETLKNEGGQVPVKPSSVPFYSGNDADSLPLYMNKLQSKWVSEDGFAVFQTTLSGDTWSTYSPGTSASISVSPNGGNGWIVYPRYKISKDGSTDYPAMNSGAAKSMWFTGNSSFAFPQKGKHWGIFDNVTDANAWRNYYNSILKAKADAAVPTIEGYVFIAGDKWEDKWEVSFNPDGTTGISSQNSLLTNINQPAGTGSAANLGSGDSAAGDSDNDSAATFRITMQYAVNTVTKKNVNILIKALMANEKLSFAQTKDKFMAEFIKARTKYQISQGKPAPEAKAIAESRAAVIFANASPNTNSGGAGNTGAPPPQATIRIPIVRGLIGYQPPPSAIGDSPQLVQKYQYTRISVDNSGAETMELIPTERRFVFPFAPKDVTYSNLSSVWTEISRTGRHPIVDWTNFQLLKVSFTFELVDRNSTDPGQPRDGFGLFYSIDEKINILRQMATAPYPVSFLNMDTFFSKELRYPLYTQGRGVEFVITDFAVQSVQRTPAQNSGGLKSTQPNQISRASCTITLQECPIEQVDIISIPQITICSKKKCPPPECPAPCEEKPKEFVLISTKTREETTPTVDPNAPS